MIASLPNRTNLVNYRFRVALSGVVFGFRFYFNRRDQHWYFDMTDAAGVLLRAGMKVVADFPLLRQWTQQNRPDGELSSIAATDTDPGLEDLGALALLVYDDENV